MVPSRRGDCSSLDLVTADHGRADPVLLPLPFSRPLACSPTQQMKQIYKEEELEIPSVPSPVLAFLVTAAR